MSINEVLTFDFLTLQYQGMFLQFLYTDLYPRLFGGSYFQIPLSVFSDVCVFGPFITLPVAYVIRAMIEDDGNAEYSGEINPFRQGLAKYSSHVLTEDLLLKYWAVWAPAQTINNCFVPEHLRVLFVAFVSFFWVYLLSSVSSSVSDAPTPATQKKGLVSN